MQSEGMEVGGALWVQVLDDLLVPLVSDFARIVSLQVQDSELVALPCGPTPAICQRQLGVLLIAVPFRMGSPGKRWDCG